MERSLRTVGTGRGSGNVRLIARTQCDDLSLLNRFFGRVKRSDLWAFQNEGLGTVQTLLQKKLDYEGGGSCENC
jgi:hypothetical protein